MAVFLSPKKFSKLGLEGLCGEYGYDLVVLTPDTWRLYIQILTIDLLLHKMADFTTSPDGQDASLWVSEYKSAVKKAALEGKIKRVIDDTDMVDILQNRVTMLEAIGACLKGLPSLDIPRWSHDPHALSGLVIRKPLDACGSPDSHIMQLLDLHSDNDTTHIPPESSQSIYQEFVPHHRVLYKLYCIGDSVDIVMRRSIGADLFALCTRRGVDFEYGVTVGKAQLEDAEAEARLEPYLADLHAFINKFRLLYKLSMFGVDVIIEEPIPCDANGTTGMQTPRAHIIDVNYFPGFDGVVDLPAKLGKCLFNDFQ